MYRIEAVSMTKTKTSWWLLLLVVKKGGRNLFLSGMGRLVDTRLAPLDDGSGWGVSYRHPGQRKLVGWICRW